MKKFMGRWSVIERSFDGGWPLPIVGAGLVGSEFLANPVRVVVE